MQGDDARGRVALVARRGLDVSFKGGDLVRDWNPQFPIEPVDQEIGLRKLDCDLSGDRLKGRLLRCVGNKNSAQFLAGRKSEFQSALSPIDRFNRLTVDLGVKQFASLG